MIYLPIERKSGAAIECGEFAAIVAVQAAVAAVATVGIAPWFGLLEDRRTGGGRRRGARCGCLAQCLGKRDQGIYSGCGDGGFGGFGVAFFGNGELAKGELLAAHRRAFVAVEQLKRLGELSAEGLLCHLPFA